MNSVFNKRIYRVSIVILNYLNFCDTIECVESVLRQNYPIQSVIVVDNGSLNQSAQKLRRHYQRNRKVTVISIDQNIGFAKGNNVGIRYARKKHGAEFVLVVNNDTKFIEDNYITALLEGYDVNVGIIGSRILLQDGSIQDESNGIFDLKQCILNYLNLFSLNKGTSFDFYVDKSKGAKMLHGCALLFTPSFFKYYQGFYPRTFLYHEEEILYLMCKFKGLEQRYVSETMIFHKEDRSSKQSFANDKMIKRKYQFQSYKFVLFWLVKYELYAFFKREKKG